MKLPDTNVLLNAINQRAAGHEQARDWMERALVAPEGVALCWNVLIGFVRLSTHRAILVPPLSVPDALAALRQWLASPRAVILHPGDRHLEHIARLLTGAGTAGNLTNDAHIAALAIEHGATVVSFDRDFERFAGLSFERLG